MKRKNQRDWFVALIIICLGVVVAGGFIYVSSLREDLTDQAILNVQTVTVQQQQAFDNFIAGDRERLHSFAVFFSHTFSDQADAIQRQLSVFCEVDSAIMSAFNSRTEPEGLFRKVMTAARFPKHFPYLFTITVVLLMLSIREVTFCCAV